MTNTIFCATRYGNGAKIVAVEGSLNRGLPSFNISGLANHSIQEAKHRVQSALQSCNLTLPPMRFVLNLSPADLPKSGSHFDLPIALLGALQKNALQEKWFAFGELGLDGSLKHQESSIPSFCKSLLKSQKPKLFCQKVEKRFSLLSLISHSFLWEIFWRL